MRTAEPDVIITKANLWLWRDFWNWELFGNLATQSGHSRRRRLACKTLYLIKYDRVLDGRDV